MLCHKLDIMGLNSQILNWLRNYLNGRIQLVKINSNIISKNINVLSGVGQGYPIGATLFLLFLIDLPYHIVNAEIKLFADDTKIILPIKSHEDCLRLQNDINNAYTFFEANFLNLNINKTKSISFHKNKCKIHHVYHINNLDIEKVYEIKDLGIILDEKLSFKNHIDYVTNKAKSRLAWVKHFAKEFNDPWVLKKLFNTYVLPIIEYGIIVWFPKQLYLISKIESVQKQFLLYALRSLKWNDKFNLPSYRSRLLLLQMNTIEDRRKISQIMFIFNILMGAVVSPKLLSNMSIKVPQRQTRSNKFLNENLCDTPYNNAKKMLNVYSELIDFNLTAKTIKNNLKMKFKLDI